MLRSDDSTLNDDSMLKILFTIRFLLPIVVLVVTGNPTIPEWDGDTWHGPGNFQNIADLSIGDAGEYTNPAGTFAKENMFDSDPSTWW